MLVWFQLAMSCVVIGSGIETNETAITDLLIRFADELMLQRPRAFRCNVERFMVVIRVLEQDLEHLVSVD